MLFWIVFLIVALILMVICVRHLRRHPRVPDLDDTSRHIMLDDDDDDDGAEKLRNT